MIVADKSERKPRLCDAFICTLATWDTAEYESGKIEYELGWSKPGEVIVSTLIKKKLPLEDKLSLTECVTIDEAKQSVFLNLQEMVRHSPFYIMSGKDDHTCRPGPSQQCAKGTRYVAGPRETSRSNLPPCSPVEHGRQSQCSRLTRSSKRLADSLDVPTKPSPLKPSPKSYMPKANNWRNVNLEEFKVKHGLQGFEVKFYGESDDLTYDMISSYEYNSTHLLTTIGQIEAGMHLPLYKTDDTFYYDVLASRNKVDGSDCRSVVQYNGNWYRILDECRLRKRGQSRLTCYTPDPAQREWYTPDNFNATYKDKVSSSYRRKWSVGLGRRKFSYEQHAAGERSLLEEIDKVIIKYVPGTEDSATPTPFPKNQKIRVDHDFKWYCTPIEIIGPWAWGWSSSADRVGQPRSAAPERYGNFCPWRLNFSGFNFAYGREEQYDLSPKARVSKKQKISHESTNVELEDDEVIEVTTPASQDDDDADVEDKEDEESEYDGEVIGDNTIPERTPSPRPADESVQPNLIAGQVVDVGTGERDSDQTPSRVRPTADVLPVVGTSQVLVGNAFGGSFSFGLRNQPVSHSDGRSVVESGIPQVTIPDSPLFDDDFILIDLSSTGAKKSHEATSATRLGPLPVSNVASTSGKDIGAVDGFASVDMSDDDVFYQWALKQHLLGVPATAHAEGNDLALNARVRDKMRVFQHDYVRDTFLNADRIYSSLNFSPAPAASVKEMTRLVDEQAYFFPHFALATLSQSQQYCYELYQLHKLKAAKFEALFRASDTELAAKREEVCNLQQQLLQEHKSRDRGQSPEKEVENLRKELAQTKADLEKAAPNAQVIEQIGKMQAELDAGKDEIVSLQGMLSFNVGLVFSTQQRAILAETEVAKLRTEVNNLHTEVNTLQTQAVERAAAHVADVVRVKREDRDAYKAKLNSFLIKVNKETGRDYQLMP